MVPLRAVGDALGLTVEWDKTAREALFSNGTKTIYFPIDSKVARGSDGSQITMDTAAVIVNSRTYSPVRYLAEFFGYTVGWDGKTKTVIISSKANTGKNPTTGEKNAVSKAKSYLNLMPFSRAGLIKQLEYEKFTSAEAVYGADNCGADWKAQAVRKAGDYLDLMAFSRSGLVKQLEFDGFTNAEAVYGVDAIGADWNAQAALKAKEYLNLMSFSKAGLISQLEYEGFTHDQAVYGVEQNGY